MTTGTLFCGLVQKVNDGKVVMEGILHKVVIPMITSPLIGFFGGFFVMSLLYLLLQKARPRFVSRFFGKAQILSASYMGFAHGLADAQKTIGIITLALVTATATGSFQNMPDWLGFLHMEKSLRAEESVKAVQNPKSTPEPLRHAAIVLETESAHLKPDEFREAFQTFSSKIYATLHDTAASERLAGFAATTHQDLLTAEKSRILTGISVLGPMVAGKFTDWQKVLTSEMKAAEATGKIPLAVAAGKSPRPVARRADLDQDPLLAHHGCRHHGWWLADH
jgi:phosphate/sulfate permease